jgi:hypothetical protein
VTFDPALLDELARCFAEAAVRAILEEAAESSNVHGTQVPTGNIDEIAA